MIKLTDILNEDYPRTAGIYVVKNSFGKGTQHFFAFGQKVKVVKIGMGNVTLKILGRKDEKLVKNVWFRELDKYFRWQGKL